MGQTIDDIRAQFAQPVKTPEPETDSERQSRGRGKAKRIIHHGSDFEFVFPGGYSSTVKSHVSLLALRQYKRRQRYLVFNEEMDAVIMFGKHKGKTVSVIHWEAPDYLRWMTTQDFDPALIDVIKKWIRPPEQWMKDIQKDGPDYNPSTPDKEKPLKLKDKKGHVTFDATSGKTYHGKALEDEMATEDEEWDPDLEEEEEGEEEVEDDDEWDDRKDPIGAIIFGKKVKRRR